MNSQSNFRASFSTRLARSIRRISLTPIILILCTGLLLFILVGVQGCSRNTQESKLPSTLKIGILPDQNRKVLLKRYTPLFKHISRELGVPYKLIIPDNYESLLKLFINGDIDLAYFGGYTFVRAQIQANAFPLVMRDIDLRFTSYFFSKSSNKIKNLEDFKGKTFSFGSRLSTSGHLMPRLYLSKKRIVPENFFGAVRYSGSHDLTAKWVVNETVDIGVANSKIINNMIHDKIIRKSDIQIIWETPPYPDYVWAIQAKYSPIIRSKIRATFLSLTPLNKIHNQILKSLNTNGFVPASIIDFQLLFEIVHKLKTPQKTSQKASGK